MKVKTTLLLFILIGCVIIYSCKKNSSGPINTVSKVTYQKRWDISSTTSARPALNTGSANNNYGDRPTGDTNYTAIEFMLDSTYVIFYPDSSLKVGQYAVKNDTTLILDSLGTVTIKSLTASSFVFELTPNNDSSVIFSTKVAPASSFSNAEDSALYSNTWVMDSVTFSGVTEIFPNSSTNELDENFSAYGTQLSRQINVNGTEIYTTATWIWSNDTHESLCYASWGGSNLTACDNATSSLFVGLFRQYSLLVLIEPGSVGAIEYFHKK
jgi:hypothetical protein